MKSDIAEQGVRYGLYGGAASIGAYLLLGRSRRRELTEVIARPGLKTGLASLTALGLIGTSIIGTSELSNAEVSAVPVDDIFDDTPLEGSRVTGEFLPHIVNTYGREIIDRWQENDTFYDQVLINTREAYEQTRRLTAHDDYPILLFYTDLHCNVGMARVLGEAARLSNAALIADGGDTTMGGTSYEKFCIQILDSELPNIPRVVAGGNHDSDETEAQYRRFGFTPLNGEPISVAGLTFIGDDDIMRSAFGAGIQKERDETTLQMNYRMAAHACSEVSSADVLLVHDPDIAERTLSEQCLNTVLSGHVHRETIETLPQQHGNTILNIIGDNASGANKQQPTLGPIESQARLYTIKFNAATGLPMFYQTLTINPDTSVELGDIVQLPQNIHDFTEAGS